MKKQESLLLEKRTASDSKAWLGAGILAALAASLCCITPVLAILAGLGGIAATFSWLEPLRPYLIAITVFVLAIAWYQKLRPRTQEEIACACEDDPAPSFWQSKRFLGIITVVAVLLLAFPYYTGVFFSDNTSTAATVTPNGLTRQATLHIQGMTCSGCEKSVNHALQGQDGVLRANASYDEGTATVQYDTEKVTIEQLIFGVEEATGYKVTRHQTDK